jgi:hypothetical protein
MEVNINQTIQPIRMVILIQPNRPKSFNRAIQLASSLWGGMYIPIFPLYKRFSHQFKMEIGTNIKPKDYYHGIVENFDPDYIIIEEGLDRAFTEEFSGDRKIIDLVEIEESLRNGKTKYGIGYDEILDLIVKEEFKYIRTDKVKIFHPIFKNEDIYLSSIFGNVYPELMNIKLKNNIEFITNKEIYTSQIIEFYNDNFLIPKDISNYKISKWESGISGGNIALFLIKKGSLNNLVTYWNIRALGWNIEPIYIDEVNSPLSISLIKKQLLKTIESKKFNNDLIILFGNNILHKESETLIPILKNLKKNLKLKYDDNFRYLNQGFIPPFWQKGDYLGYNRAKACRLGSEMKNENLNISNSILKFELIKSPFKYRYIDHGLPRIKVLLEYNYQEFNGEYAEAIPKIESEKLTRIIRGSGFNQWRFSDRGTYYLMRNDEKNIQYTLPESLDIFEKYFEQNGFQIEHLPLGKLSKELLNNIGGIKGINFFTSNSILEILSLFENGNIVLKTSLFGLIKKNIKELRVRSINLIIQSLIWKQIIEFGTKIQCPICNQNSFYSLDQLNNKINCPICKSRFNAPAHDPDLIKWAYRGIGPFARNNKAEGVISVFLTLRFFRITLASLYGGITPLYNFKVNNKNTRRETNFEIDLGVFYRGIRSKHLSPDLFFCECKHNKGFDENDINRMKLIGESFPGSILTFATLNNELTEKEKKLIIKLAKGFRKGLNRRPLNPILILTKNELINSFGLLNHLELNHSQSFEDEIGHLTDVTCKKYLGLQPYGEIIEKKWQEKFTKRRKNITKKQQKDP